MSLFGKNEHKAAEQAAAKAEVERLTRLPVADLAAELMGAFPDQASTHSARKCANCRPLKNSSHDNQ